MLYNFLSRFANYNLEYVTTILAESELLMDPAFVDRKTYQVGKESGIDFHEERTRFFSEQDGYYKRSWVLNLDGGILNCPQPLVPNTEVKFSFERVPATYSLFFTSTTETAPTALDNGKAVTINDAFLELEYVSSPYLRNLNASIIEKPLTYHYDDCQIYMKDVTKGSQSFRVNSLCGGLTPEYVFAGFLPSKCLDPDFVTTSLTFKDPGVREACITLNGALVQGYPISALTPDSMIQFYCRFMDTIGKTKLTSSAGSLSFYTFKEEFMLLSHRFEGEQSDEGWIGFDIKFSSPTTRDYTFGEI